MPKYGLSLILISRIWTESQYMDKILFINANQRKFGIFYVVIVINHHRTFFLVYLVVI